MDHSFFLDLSIVVVASSTLAWLSILSKQPLILAYILAGFLLGPWGFKLVSNLEFIDNISSLGVTLLLFLAGITLHPKRVKTLFKISFPTTLISSLIFALVFGFSAKLFGFSNTDSVFIGLGFMFSSTILVVKLLPTTTLHQKQTGATLIAILVLQDVIAVSCMLIASAGISNNFLYWFYIIALGVILIVFALAFEKWALRIIFKHLSHYHEVLFLMTLAWCFSLAVIAGKIGLSPEMGAFIAGVALANNPISTFLSEGLKFFRDFFLVLFFFTLGARINIWESKPLILPAVVISLLIILLKPYVFKLCFKAFREPSDHHWEMGVRLGQASEFSLIFGMLCLNASLIGNKAFQLLQYVTILTLILSSYWVVFKFPTPLGFKRFLKKD